MADPQPLSSGRAMTCSTPRRLTPEEMEKLDNDQTIVSDFKQLKLEKEAEKNWDLFYKRNTTKFFKDRHWTTREFEELCGEKVPGSKLTVLEVGCGVGNFVFPLIEEVEDVYFYACDFSKRAVQFVKEHPLYSEERCHAFHCDLTQHQLTDNVPQHSVEYATMIFVLSAIHPDKVVCALRNIHSVLKPGGCVLLRDYGLHDHAMLRFGRGHKLSEHFYVRQDGTRAFYFTTDQLARLFDEAGFETISNEYVLRETVNKKEGLCVPRVFVQAKFRKIPYSLARTANETGESKGRNSCADPIPENRLHSDNKDSVEEGNSVPQEQESFSCFTCSTDSRCTCNSESASKDPS